MKDIELKLISELMKNARRSDRDLAKALGVSQPTATRLRTKLEKEGYIKEYTIVPNFSKIGFEILSFTFAKLKGQTSQKELEETRKDIREMLRRTPISSILAMSGMGCNADRVVVAFHQDYSAYANYIRMMRQHPLVEVEEVKSFLVNLDDQTQFMPMTFNRLANYISTELKKPEKTETRQDTFRLQPTRHQKNP